MNYDVVNEGPHDALNVRVTIFLFDNISGWAEQRIITENIKVDGNPINPRIYKTIDNRWTVVEIGTIRAYEKKTISVNQTLLVKSVDFSIEQSRVEEGYPQELEEYTRPVPGLFESDDPRIQELAVQLTEGISNPYLKLKRILEYVSKNIAYERQEVEHSALWCLLNRKGDCTEFSNLMIALARAVGIPAKAVVGYAYLPMYETGTTSSNFVSFGHEYAIFYLLGYGWVPADAVWPLGEGTLGKSSQYHIAGAATDGKGVVRGGGAISWPGPGYVHREWNYVSGKPAEITGSTSGEIITEVLMRLELEVGWEIENDTLPVTIRIKNEGRFAAKNLKASIDADPTRFQLTQAYSEIPLLEAGEEIAVRQSIRILENGYGTASTLMANVYFDPDYPSVGTLCSSGKIEVRISPKPEMPVSFQDPLLLALVGLIVAVAVVGIAIAVKR